MGHQARTANATSCHPDIHGEEPSLEACKCLDCVAHVSRVVVCHLSSLPVPNMRISWPSTHTQPCIKHSAGSLVVHPSLMVPWSSCADGNNLTEPGDEGSSRPMLAPASTGIAGGSQRQRHPPPAKSVQPQRMRPADPQRASQPDSHTHPAPPAASTAPGPAVQPHPAGLQQAGNARGHSLSQTQMGAGAAGLQPTAGPSGYPPGLQVGGEQGGQPPLSGSPRPGGHPQQGGHPPKPPKAKKEKSKKHRHLLEEGADASVSSGMPPSGSTSEHRHKKHKHKKHRQHGHAMATDNAGLLTQPMEQAPTLLVAGQAASAQPPASAATTKVAGTADPIPMLATAAALSSGLLPARQDPSARQPASSMTAPATAPLSSIPQPHAQAALDPLGYPHGQHAPDAGPMRAGADSQIGQPAMQPDAPPMQQPSMTPNNAAQALQATLEDQRCSASQARPQRQGGPSGEHEGINQREASMQAMAGGGRPADIDHPGSRIPAVQGAADVASSAVHGSVVSADDRQLEESRTATEGNGAAEGLEALHGLGSEGHGQGQPGAASTPREGSGAYLQDLDQESLPPKKKRHKGFTIKLGGRTL